MKITSFLSVSVISFLTFSLQSGAQVIERVSVSSAGEQGDDDSSHPSLSTDGRFVVFVSQSTNFANINLPGSRGQLQGRSHIFLHDRETDETVLISTSSEEIPANNESSYPFLSGDGRFVAFESRASNLVLGVYCGSNIFIHDPQARTTEDLLASSRLARNCYYTSKPSLSADGRFVAFEKGLTTTIQDIFVSDRQAGMAEQRVSVDSTGRQGNGISSHPSLSADGRFVAFESRASNLVPGDTAGRGDVFVHDRQTGTTERVSVNSAGEQANQGSWGPFLTADGRHVVFESSASNLASGDTDTERDVFIHDRQNRTTEQIPISAVVDEGDTFFLRSMSADGRYLALELSPNGLEPERTSVVIYSRSAGRMERVSVNATGEEGSGGSFNPSLSADGRFVAFESHASDLLPGDTNEHRDVFVVSNPLYTPPPPPEPVADLRIDFGAIPPLPSGIQRGRLFSLRAVIINRGPDLARGTLVTGTFPSGLRFVSFQEVSAGTSCERTPTGFRCSLGDVETRGGRFIRVAVLGGQVGSFSVSAEVTSETRDSGMENNREAETVTVTRRP